MTTSTGALLLATGALLFLSGCSSEPGGGDQPSGTGSTGSRDGTGGQGGAGGVGGVGGAGGVDGTGGVGGTGGAAAAPPMDLDMMTFNIRYANRADGVNYWPNRRDMVYQVIGDANPDVLGLQEALRSQLDDLRGALPYSEIGVGRDDGVEAGEYSAILYRAARFDVDESGTFWLSDTPEEPGSTSFGNMVVRICTWARLVEKSSGRGFYFFNTHLDHESQPSRARSAELIADRIAKRTHPDPVFLTGDFNAGEVNPAVLYIKGEAARASEGTAPVPAPPGFVDTFRVLYPNEAPVGTFNGFSGADDGEKIDFIFAQPAPITEVLLAQIIRDNQDGLYPSDHFPVTARVRLHP